MPLAQTIGLETLSKYFHLPINDVAKELGVCATVLKKICRKNGIPRWPHRKIKSLDKMILTLEASVAKNPEDNERIQHEIRTLRNKKLFLMKNPNVLATKAPSMKKGIKQKNDQSPIGSPESPTNRTDYPLSPYAHPYGYPFAFADPSQFHVPYPNYNMYGNPAMKAYPYPYYPYPHHYPEHMLDHRRLPESDECLSPSMVFDPVAAALFVQMPHPHMPHSSPSTVPRLIEAPTSNERSQWVPSDSSSAFTPKSLRAKLSPQPGYLPDVFNDQSAHMVPQHSPRGHFSPHHSPSNLSSDFLIHLPEIRLPEEKERPKLSTLEPSFFRPNGDEAPTSPSQSPAAPSIPVTPPLPPSNNKWQLPEWFEAERTQQRKEGDGEVAVPSGRTPPMTISE